MTTTQWIVLGALVAFVVILNYSLFDAWRKRKNSSSGSSQLQKMGERFMNPWKEEDDDLRELSRRVKDLKKDE